MFATYLVVTLLAAAVNGLAAAANFVGHDYPKSQADKLSVPRSWMRPLGALLAAGALGLLSGLAVPVLGTLAAAGLVLYFLGAPRNPGPSLPAVLQQSRGSPSDRREATGHP